MKISNANFINQAYTSQTNSQSSAQQAAQLQAERKSATEESSGGMTQDSINLSSTTKDLQKIEAASDNTPPEREQRVQELKEMVESNQYTVNAEQVAEKMIGSIMNEIG